MSEKIDGASGFTHVSVDPDESPDRADKGYTGVDPNYQNAANKTYAPQGKLSLVPKAEPFGYVGDVDEDGTELEDEDDDNEGEPKDSEPETPVTPVAEPTGDNAPGAPTAPSAPSAPSQS